MCLALMAVLAGLEPGGRLFLESLERPAGPGIDPLVDGAEGAFPAMIRPEEPRPERHLEPPAERPRDALQRPPGEMLDNHAEGAPKEIHEERGSIHLRHEPVSQDRRRVGSGLPRIPRPVGENGMDRGVAPAGVAAVLEGPHVAVEHPVNLALQNAKEPRIQGFRKEDGCDIPCVQGELAGQALEVLIDEPQLIPHDSLYCKGRAQVEGQGGPEFREMARGRSKAERILNHVGGNAAVSRGLTLPGYWVPASSPPGRPGIFVA